GLVSPRHAIALTAAAHAEHLLFHRGILVLGIDLIGFLHSFHFFHLFRGTSLASLSPLPLCLAAACDASLPVGQSVSLSSIHFPSLLARLPLRIALRPRPPCLYIRLLR
ncbi:uncharacterized protein BO80DRAFT_381026, partial [Aspergillus ibericus CBS 121593]